MRASDPSSFQFSLRDTPATRAQKLEILRQAFASSSGGGSGITQLTGDVAAGPGSGSQPATIALKAVTLPKMADLAANSIVGNNTGAPATPLALSAAQVKTLLAIAATDVSGLAAIAASGSGADLGAGTVTLAKITNIADQTILGNNSGGAGPPLALTATQGRTVLGLGTVATLASDVDTTLAANSDLRVATQKAIKTYIDNSVAGLLDYKGGIACAANPNYPAALKGDAYNVTTAGLIGGAGGKAVDIGDVVVATADNAGGTEAAVGASWIVLEHNLTGALVAANNLSDVTNAGTARTNLGLAAIAASGSGADLSAASVTYAKIQNVTNSRVLGRNTAGAGVAEEVTASQVLDWIGSTQGNILYRQGGASGWGVLAVGTAGQFLKTGGAGANPSWADAVIGVTAANGVSAALAAGLLTFTLGAITPSSVACTGNMSGTDITANGVLYFKQATPVARNASTTLTIADLLTGIITATSAAAVSLTLPTGTLTDAGIQGGALANDRAFEWGIINLGSTSGAVTLVAGTAHTIVGSATVAIGTSARFWTRKTAANTYVTYRM